MPLTTTSHAILPATPARILVFDSGVGGLSVAQEIRALLPQLPLVYASDNAAFPYGVKGEAELNARVDAVMQALLQRYPVNLVVIACNTASTLALNHLRERFKLPFVGVVPAIKPAANSSVSKVIGLLATPATIARPYTHQLIRDYASHCEVISLGSSELVLLAEQKLRGEAIASGAIENIVQQLLASNPRSREMDRLVLACTHFPLLHTELSSALPPQVQLIDSGAAIARRVKHLLEQQGSLTTRAIASEDIAVFTQASREVEMLAPALAQNGLQRIEITTV